jgi:hypothetical protein
MTDTSAGHGQGAGRYEIRLKGHLGPRWAAWFDGLTLTRDDDGTTVIHGPVVDQAALYGLLNKVRDLGLSLISVTQVEPDRLRPPERKESRWTRPGERRS